MKTVTVGIPAHNEETNIANILRSIIAQKRSGFKLEKVIVILDGCTDNTSKIVSEKAKKYKYIEIIEDGVRKGKAQRLNELFEQNKSDVLIIFDADVILGNNYVVKNLVKAFDEANVGILAGHDLPKKPTNLIEKIAVANINLWYEIRKNYLDGDNVHNLHGCVMAMSKKFAQVLRLPHGLISEDIYIYLEAKKLGFDFRFAKKALVYYQVPSTISDYLKQSARFVNSNSEMDVPKIPNTAKLKPTFLFLLKYPIITLVALFFQFLTRFYLSYFYRNSKNPIWSQAVTTKKI